MINLPKPQPYTTRLGYIEKVSSKVYLKRLDLVEPKEITFLPGQTVMLQVAPGVNRSMSIASPPSEKTSILAAHDISPMGPYSQWTIKAKVGDTMTFMGPLGAFVFNKESLRNKVFIATGTGIAPFRSMLLDLFAHYEPSTMNYALSLYWGLRHEEDIFWKEQFEDLAQKNPSFRFILTLSQPGESWTGKRGRVGDHVFVDEKNLTENDYYLCGSNEMIQDMEIRLLAAGVPKEQIKKELFY